MGILKGQMITLCLVGSFTFIVVGSASVADSVRNSSKVNSQTAESLGHRISKRQACSGEFQCNNGNCVNIGWLCDYDNDCGDNSDEFSYNCDACAVGNLKCDDGGCVPTRWMCDGANDCGDGSDEACFGYCAGDLFECWNGRCIAANLQCDNTNDCGDYTDEQNCPTTTATASPQCDAYQWRCDSGYCISLTYVCDGVSHCFDRSDENNFLCSAWTTTAASTYLFPKTGVSWDLPIGLGVPAGLIVIVAIIGVLAYNAKRATRRRQAQAGNTTGASGNQGRPLPNNPAPYTIAAASSSMSPPHANQPYFTPQFNQRYPVPQSNQPYRFPQPNQMNPALPPYQMNPGFAGHNTPHLAPGQTTYPVGMAQPAVSSGPAAQPVVSGALATNYQSTATSSNGTQELPPAPTYDSLYSSGSGAAPEPATPALPSDVQQQYLRPGPPGEASLPPVQQ